MPLRLFEILVPSSQRGALEMFLEGQRARGFWFQTAGPEKMLVRVLADTEKSGEIMDGIADLFEGQQDVHVVLLPVEAALPKPEEDDPDSERDQSKEDGESGEEAKGPLARISREELHGDLSANAQVTPHYLVTVVLSSIVAGIGLLRDDVAVIIGAMVIAPLLAPNMALSLATTLADTTLGRRALRANLAGVALALACSILLGSVVPVDLASEQISRRTMVGFQDLALALAAGGAGALAVASGTQVALVGVMVAVALLPPVVNVGLLIGAGEFSMMVGAGMLVLANVICVNLAGVVTFLSLGIRPRTWWEADRARTATRLAILLWVTLLLLLTLPIVWMSLRSKGVF